MLLSYSLHDYLLLISTQYFIQALSSLLHTTLKHTQQLHKNNLFLIRTFFINVHKTSCKRFSMTKATCKAF